jgi:hypothetical protein
MVTSSSSKPPTKLSQRESPPASPLAEEDIPSDVPVAFAAGIGAKNIQACIRLLDKCPDALTQSGSAFEWLKDPLAIGLNSTEIVDLLFEESEQSPWICYELVLPATHDTTVIDSRPDYIQPALPGRYGDSIVKISEVEVKRKISELCGLGGIIPTPGDRTLWRTNISNEIEELGTWPEKWTLREIQTGFQGGQFLNSTFNATWIKSDSRTRKQQGLKKVDLDFLNQPWGVLVSVCAGVAQRVALREVVAEVLSPMMDAWMEKTPEWQILLSIGVLEELKKPTFRD